METVRKLNPEAVSVARTPAPARSHPEGGAQLNSIADLPDGAPEQDARHPVVILIHGIRTCSLWQSEIQATLRNGGVVAHLTHYEYFDLLRFLAPGPYFRRRVIEKVKTQIRHIVQDSAPAPVSVIAHSFGAYVFAQIFRECPDLAFDRIIFCGSVAPSSFRLEDHETRFNAPLINEIGARDVWPAIAEAVTFGYGSAGTYGFRRPFVRDRRHHGFAHSDFLNAGFCRKYWLPWLRGGEYIEGDAPKPARSPRWLYLFVIFNIRTLLAFLLLWFGAPYARAYWGG
ncbi:hypothetical protein CCR94_22910 [Rhodoblastus sphagnicola]|uniref:AB hydrolase-1 domain-containing protein n=2 Tax=Rhodoblastus sphagnicola TaxID=333368 RepID=A0A2S6MVT2_9HYPH|nr:hypothetical protein CCR94_22910 [Rhodoblastus sphagnicola]